MLADGMHRITSIRRTADTLMNRTACATPEWEFIAGSTFKPRLDSSEVSVYTYILSATECMFSGRVYKNHRIAMAIQDNATSFGKAARWSWSRKKKRAAPMVVVRCLMTVIKHHKNPWVQIIRTGRLPNPAGIGCDCRHHVSSISSPFPFNPFCPPSHLIIANLRILLHVLIKAHLAFGT